MDYLILPINNKFTNEYLYSDENNINSIEYLPLPSPVVYLVHIPLLSYSFVLVYL